MTQEEKEIYKKYKNKISKMTEEDFIRFVRIFLHHFATPMLPLIGYLDLLKKGDIKGTKRIYSVFIDKLERLAKLRSEMVNVTESYYNKKYREPKQEVIEINKKTDLKQPKILMVEDDLFLCKIYKKAFREAGFSGKIFSNADNIIKNIIKEKPDIISMGIVLSMINGYEAVKLIKQNPITKNIPVIGFDNLSGREYFEKAIRLGFTNYIVMTSVTPKQYVEIIKSYLTGTKK